MSPKYFKNYYQLLDKDANGILQEIANNSNAGQKSAEGRFLSKWVYKFYPSQKLVHLSGYSPLKSHMGVVNFPKMCAKSSSL